MLRLGIPFKYALRMSTKLRRRRRPFWTCFWALLVKGFFFASNQWIGVAPIANLGKIGFLRWLLDQLRTFLDVQSSFVFREAPCGS